MTTSDNLTIAIVPGAWHKAVHVQPVLDALRQEGVKALSIELSTVQTNKPRPTWDQEVDNISSQVLSELNTGRDVVLVLHSYAGLPGTEAVNRLVQSDALEKSQTRGTLRRVIFFAAQHFPTGFVVDTRNFLGPPFPSLHIDEHDMSTYRTPYEDFFNDLATKEDAQPYIEEVKPMYYIPGGGAVTSDDWLRVARTIFGCSNDKSLAPAIIKQMWSGHEDEIEWLSCGHTPFFAKPQYIANALLEASVRG